MSGQREEEELLQLATALSLLEHQEKYVAENIHRDLHEDEYLQLALVVSETMLEGQRANEEPQGALAGLQTNQEEVEIEVALALSVADLEKQQEEMFLAEDLIDLREQDDPLMGGGWHIVAEEERFWPFDGFPLETQTVVREPPDFELAEMYKDYRLVPTLFSEDQMWPGSAIRNQQRELRLSGGSEAVTQWREGESEGDRCLVCLSNIATRVAVPCGHRLCCRTCLAQLADENFFYSVTGPDGLVEPTDRRIPVQCFVCRAIVAQTIVVR